MSIPFSPYDFFGFLVPGFLAILAAERAFGRQWIIDQDLKVTSAAFWIGGAYIIGHIVANVSSYFIEHKLIRGVIGCPEDLLFIDEPKTPARPPLKERIMTWQWWVGWINPVAWWRRAFPVGWRRGMFPIYCKAFPYETRSRILKKSAKEGFDKPSRALFLYCHTLVKRDKTTLDRLTSFINMYGFCRNVCMGGLIAAVILVIGACRDLQIVGAMAQRQVHTECLWWAAAAVAVSVGMLYRYLKFYRHYTTELFLSYSEMAEPSKSVAEQPKT